MIPTVIDDLTSFAAANRILTLESTIDLLSDQLNQQARAINSLIKQNKNLKETLETVQNQALTLERVDETLIKIQFDQSTKIKKLERDFKINKGLQTSLTKTVLTGFNQINENRIVNTSTIDNLIKNFEKLSL